MRIKKIIAALIITFFLFTHSIPVLQPQMRGVGWLSTSPAGCTEASLDYYQISLNYVWDGKGEGKTRLLHDDWMQCHFGIPYQPRIQGPAPSCVGQAAAAAVDFLASVEANNRDQMERAPPARCSAAVIYGLARQEVAGLGDISMGGAMVQWACVALQDYGAVASINYRLIGIDLRDPSPVRCIEYGMQGCPDSLEGIARLHSVRGFVRIGSWEQFRDAIATGHPVIVGSNIGFGDGVRTRDADGFLNRPRWWKKGYHWSHAMVGIGMSDQGRKGGLLLNSWGSDWLVGPERFKTNPDGSFFVDAAIIDEMCKQNDAFALVGFYGYPKRFTLR